MENSHRYHLDNLGSIVRLTDKAGKQAQKYEYDPYGNIVEAEGKIHDNAFRHAGKYYDDEAGLYYYGARYYNPRIGRWLSEDPILANIYSSRDNNPYQFCYNNPNVYRDEWGMSASGWFIETTTVNIFHEAAWAGGELTEKWAVTAAVTRVFNWGKLFAEIGKAALQTTLKETLKLGAKELLSYSVQLATVQQGISIAIEQQSSLARALPTSSAGEEMMIRQNITALEQYKKEVGTTIEKVTERLIELGEPSTVAGKYVEQYAPYVSATILAGLCAPTVVSVSTKVLRSPIKLYRFLKYDPSGHKILKSTALTLKLMQSLSGKPGLPPQSIIIDQFIKTGVKITTMIK